MQEKQKISYVWLSWIRTLRCMRCMCIISVPLSEREINQALTLRQGCQSVQLFWKVIQNLQVHTI